MSSMSNTTPKTTTSHGVITVNHNSPNVEGWLEELTLLHNGIGYHPMVQYFTTKDAKNKNMITPTTITTTTSSTLSSPEMTNVDRIVEQLLHECWSYHQEQEMIRNNNTINGCTNVTNKVSVSSSSSSLPFVRKELPSQPQPPPKFVPSSFPSEATTTTTTRSIEEDHHQQKQVQERIDQAKERAQKILQRFQQQQQHDHDHNSNRSDVNTFSGAIATKVIADTCSDNNTFIAPIVDYIQQRQIGFRREEQRKHAAFIKNLQYLLNQQQHRVEQLSTRIIPVNTTTTTQPCPPSLPMPNHHGSSQSNHQPMAVISGKKKRNLNDRKNQKTFYNDDDTTSSNDPTTTTNSNSNNTVAIYISTQPPITTTTTTTNNNNNNNTTEPTTMDGAASTPTHLYWNETYLQQLFQTYGTIRNIYLYRHKKKRSTANQCIGGEYKGDGIIVYKLNNSNIMENDNSNSQQEHQALLDLVCGQMNGAELPCGTILNVEPATTTTTTTISTTNATTNYPDVTMVNTAAVTAPTNEVDLVPSLASFNNALKEHPSLSTNMKDPNDTNHTESKNDDDDDDDDLDQFFESL